MEFTTNINAPRQRVWEVLLNDNYYRQWAAVFAPNSHAITDWEKGSKVLFVESTKSGMASVVDEHIPGKYIRIRHLGIVKNGVEDYDSEEAKIWKDSLESYTAEDELDGTKLTITLSGAEIPRELEQMFTAMWPEALQKLKLLAESK